MSVLVAMSEPRGVRSPQWVVHVLVMLFVLYFGKLFTLRPDSVHFGCDLESIPAGIAHPRTRTASFVGMLPARCLATDSYLL